jgi:hypothetical protein
MSRKNRPNRSRRESIKTRGHPVGYCAICGALGPLTEDHVPPKGCSNSESHFVRPLGQEPEDHTTSISQGGVKFKTICSICNNDRLGARYDRDLIALAREVARYVDLAKLGIRLPRAVRVTANPHRIARAVTGHVLAAAAVPRNPRPPANFPMEDSLREFFLDPVGAVPHRWKFHYWLYPRTEKVVAKYFSRLDTSTRRLSIGHCLKFFPLGFFMSWKPETRVSEHGHEWDENAHLGDLFFGGPFGPEDESELEFWPYQNVPAGFPERPSESAMVAFNDANAYLANPR